MTGTEIEIALRDYDQSRISQACAALKRIDLVRTRREGKWIYYSLREARWQALSKAIEVIIADPDSGSDRKRKLHLLDSEN